MTFLKFNPRRNTALPAFIAILIGMGAAFAQVPSASNPTGEPPAVVRTPNNQAQYDQWVKQHKAWEDRYAAWAKRYAIWLDEQSRLDDGLLLSLGLGLSPTKSGADLFGEVQQGLRVKYLNLRGLGGTVDFKIGWMVKNDPFLSEYYFHDDKLHDQIYVMLDWITRITPDAQLRYRGDSTRVAAPVFTALDMCLGPGFMYYVYPYNTSVGASAGVGFLAAQASGENRSVRTDLGPAVNVQVSQDWRISENWKIGVALTYGYLYAVNHPQLDNQTTGYQRENWSTNRFSILFTNTITPPKFRRGTVEDARRAAEKAKARAKLP